MYRPKGMSVHVGKERWNTIGDPIVEATGPPYNPVTGIGQCRAD